MAGVPPRKCRHSLTSRTRNGLVEEPRGRGEMCGMYFLRYFGRDGKGAKRIILYSLGGILLEHWLFGALSLFSASIFIYYKSLPLLYSILSM